MGIDRIGALYGRLFPELKLFPDVHQRRNALRIASRQVRHWAYGLSMPWCVGVVFAGKWLARAYGEFSDVLMLFPAGLLMGVGIGYVPLVVCSARIRKSLREQLNAVGTLVCVRCGYRLRGLTVGRCPECGTEFSGTGGEVAKSGEE